MTLEYEIQEILEMYINLSKIAQWKIFECMVYILTLTLRSDKRQAILTVKRFQNDLIQISIDITDNRNIIGSCFGANGMRLDSSDETRTSQEFLNKILWRRRQIRYSIR